VLPYNKNLKKFAQQLRDDMTEAENHLWWKIKNKQVKGLIFYRQKPIGEYIVDFYCPKAKLAIEIDGSHHSVGETIEYDRIRGDYLNSLGLTVLRFTNADVLESMKGVLEKIETEINTKIPLGPPFSKGETKKEKIFTQELLPLVKGDKRGIYNEGVR
jgi:very-short-patch-repair endonuclease